MRDTIMPPRWLRVGVHSVRTATTVAALTLLVGFGAVGVVATPQPSAPSTQLGLSMGPLDALIEQNRCSVTGFDRDVIPRSAIVRTPGGGTELVSFDRGWAVFSGQAAGELVAVCLGPKPSVAPDRGVPNFR